MRLYLPKARILFAIAAIVVMPSGGRKKRLYWHHHSAVHIVPKIIWDSRYTEKKKNMICSESISIIVLSFTGQEVFESTTPFGLGS